MITFKYTGVSLIEFGTRKIEKLEKMKDDLEKQEKMSFIRSLHLRSVILDLQASINKIQTYLVQLNKYDLQTVYDVTIEEIQLFGIT